jgi:hypothetical protein
VEFFFSSVTQVNPLHFPVFDLQKICKSGFQAFPASSIHHQASGMSARASPVTPS